MGSHESKGPLVLAHGLNRVLWNLFGLSSGDFAPPQQSNLSIGVSVVIGRPLVGPLRRHFRTAPDCTLDVIERVVGWFRFEGRVCFTGLSKLWFAVSSVLDWTFHLPFGDQ